MLALLTVLAALADAPPPPDVVPGPESSGDRRVGPFSRDTYPSEVISRPLTLPAGMIRADATLDEDWIRLSTVDWSTSLAVGASYGLTHQLEVSAFARFGLISLVEIQRVGIAGALLVHDGPSFDLALAASFDVVPSFAGTFSTLTLGLPGRLLLGDRLFLTFGGQLVALQLSPFFPEVALKLGLGAQITSALAVTLETDVLKLLGESAVSRTLGLPLDLSVVLAVAHGVDVRARVVTVNVANPRLAGTFTLAGSVYY
jgi:hypothetical protein